jgi:hypothetical protein
LIDQYMNYGEYLHSEKVLAMKREMYAD